MNETQLLLLLAAIFAVSFLSLWLVEAVSFYRKYHGKRVIVCPETKKDEEVQVAAAAGAARILLGPDLHLKNCTRWPERAGCGQDCLSQIEESPEECLAGEIARHWYEGKACAVCGKPFVHMEWHQHRPGLLAPDGRTLLWSEVPLRELRETLATHKPLCWQCHIHEGFRHEHPELVTDRAAHQR